MRPTSIRPGQFVFILPFRKDFIRILRSRDVTMTGRSH